MSEFGDEFVVRCIDFFFAKIDILHYQNFIKKYPDAEYESSIKLTYISISPLLSRFEPTSLPTRTIFTRIKFFLAKSDVHRSG